MMNALNVTRRQILLGGTSVVAASGLGLLSSTAYAADTETKPLPAYVGSKDRDSLIVHTGNTIETKRGALGTSVITAEDRLFVRNNLSPPPVSIVADRDAWVIRVEGVREPRQLSVAELKRMGLDSVGMVLQCSGNGRGFSPHKASGARWEVGAAGCVIFSGVPVAAVVKALGGPTAGMRFMTTTGGEEMPAGIDPKSVIVERSVPVAAMKDALLVWEMNGEPLSLAHGGPLRLVVPGFYGVNHVKYAKQLAFTVDETDAAIQSSGYRFRPIGVKGDPSQPTMWQMNVKSWIDEPSGSDETIRAGMFQVSGVAFGGTHAVKQVDVSVDGGKSWKKAELIGPNLGRYAWRRFVLPVRLAAGPHMLVSRATDDTGQTQPADRQENERSYGNNAWRDHGIKVTVA